MKEMDKFSTSKSSVDANYRGIINFIAGTLILLVAFNLSWLIMFVRLYNRLSIVKDLNKVLFNYESWLLIGNLSIVILLIAYALGVKSIKEILGRKN